MRRLVSSSGIVITVTVKKLLTHITVTLILIVTSDWCYGNLLYSGCTTTNHNKWSKNFDERPHCRSDFLLERFNVTLNCFCSRPVWTLVSGMQQNPDVKPAENSARWRVWKSGHHPLKSAPAHGGSRPSPHLMLSSLVPPESTTQTASQ